MQRENWNHKILKAINTGARTIKGISEKAGCHQNFVHVAMIQLQKSRWLVNNRGELTVTDLGHEAIKATSPAAAPQPTPKPEIAEQAPPKRRGPGRPRKYPKAGE